MKKSLVILALCLGMVAQVNAKKQNEDGLPESLPMKKDTLSERTSGNPRQVMQTLAMPSTMERTSVAPPSAQQLNDQMAANVKDSLIRVKKIRFSSELVGEEKALKLMFDSLLTRDTYSQERIDINDRIFNKMRDVLRLEGSFFYPFDSLKNIGRIYSDDYNIRVYTWCIELEDLSYRFYGFVQNLDNDLVYPLTQNGAVYVPRDNQQLVPRQWYGALYYKVLNIQSGDEPKYIVLGWSQPNPNTKMKVIDVLDFDIQDRLWLGGDQIFKGYRGKANRMVFTYCSNLNMSLVYDEKKKRFVFDHVTPLSDEYDNPLGCNGPDMSYDELKKKGKRWILKTDVNVTNDFE